MKGDMHWNYERWDQRNSAIAAFARGDTAFGWVDGYLDEAAARNDAMLWCAQHGPDCEIIEVRGTLAVDERVGLPLSAKMATILTRVQATPGHTAMAVSDIGAYGIGRGQTLDVAAANALEICTSAAAKDRPSFLPTYPCKVIFQR